MVATYPATGSPDWAPTLRDYIDGKVAGAVGDLVDNGDGTVDYTVNGVTVTLPLAATLTVAVEAAQAAAAAAAAARTAAEAVPATSDGLMTTIINNVASSFRAAMELIFVKKTLQPVNVKDYASLVAGSDWTAAIDAAWAVANGTVKRELYFPAGNYFYDGSGLVGSSYAIRGEGQYITALTLGAGKYLIKPTGNIGHLDFRGLTVNGGAGTFQSSYGSGQVVNRPMNVFDCSFNGYTACAWEHAAPDWPWWKFKRNTFNAANDTTTMAVALPGLADQNTFEDNNFLRNRVHIKLAEGGNNANIGVGNSFLRMSAYSGTPRIDVWIVPKAGSAVNAGQGFTIDKSNKFGPENLDANDMGRIVYADEGAGSTFGSKFPNLAADSTGFIVGHHTDGAFYGAVSPVYSTTPFLIGNKWAGFWDHQTSGMVAVKLRTVPRVFHGSYSRVRKNNIVGPFHGPHSPHVVTTSASNEVGLGRVDDPGGFLIPGTPWAPQPGASSTTYRSLTTVLPRAFTNFAGGTKADVPDVYGGTEATELTTTGAGSGMYLPAAIAAPDSQNAWVSIDLAPGSSSPLSEVQVDLQDFGSQKMRTWRLPVPASGWQTFLLGPHNFEYPIGGSNWLVLITGLAAGKVQVGQVKCYQSRNPVAFRPSVTAALDFPSIAAAGQQELTVTLLGAAVGDNVVLGPPATLPAGLIANGYVSAADTVKVRLSNITAAAIDPASASWRVGIQR